MPNKPKKRVRLICRVDSRTMYNLDVLAAVAGFNNVGRVVDKLVREKMLSMKGKGGADE